MLPALMQATSRETLHSLHATLDRVGSGLDAERAGVLSTELAEVAHLLDGEPALRRALADPSAEAQARESLARSLFGSRVSEATASVVVDAARAQWSTPGDLVDGINDLSHQAAFLQAEKDGSFATVEDELFRFGRVLDANGELEQTLSDVAAPVERKQQLMTGLVGGKVHPTTARLLSEIISTPRGQSVYNAVQTLVDDAAARRRRSVAVVKAPQPLTAEQESRLTGSLSRIYGREIAVSVDVDPTILGGLRVQVGDDVIDGSVSSRLNDIQRRFAD